MYPTTQFGTAIIEERLRHYLPRPHRRVEMYDAHYLGRCR